VDVEAVARGVREAAALHGAAVIGGDVSRSPGPLVLDVVAVGCTAWPVHRDGAEPGDHVWVTGTIGGAAAAVRLWQGGDEPPPDLRAAFATPTARTREARALVEREVVDAMIDVSDGLAGDAGHVAAASGVAITLEEERIPVAEAVRSAMGREEALDLALHGGEDYELCFVTDPDVVDTEDFERRFGVPVTRVGTVSEGEGVWLLRADGTREAIRGGFDHWQDVSER
jgi:thiamine-monophosphate kinase